MGLQGEKESTFPIVNENMICSPKFEMIFGLLSEQY